MKIGLVIFSHTGNTLAVAQRLKEKLEKDGHKATLERLTVRGGYRPSMEKFDFDKLPDLKKYDGLVLGAPVMAFSLCPPMKRYLGEMGRLDGKKAVCLTTEQLPFKWMGGNRALKTMRQACLAAGAAVLSGGVVNWSRRDREERIAAVIEKLSGCF